MKFAWISKLLFLFRSTNAHGIHSPFIFDWVTQCLYKKRIHEAKIKKLIPKFHQSLNVKQIQILRDSLRFLKLKDIYTEAPGSHGIFKIMDSSDIKVSKETSDQNDAFFIATYQKKLALDLDTITTKDTFCIIFEAPHYNIDLWNRLQEIFKASIIVDTFNWGFIFLGKKQKPQTFKIRTNRFLKWDYKPIRL